MIFAREGEAPSEPPYGTATSSRRTIRQNSATRKSPRRIHPGERLVFRGLNPISPKLPKLTEAAGIPDCLRLRE